VWQWNCNNPERHGVRSLFFYYRIKVTFPPKCNDKICFFARGHDEYGHVCISSDYIQYTAVAQLRDLCDSPIKNRNIPTACFVDIDEYVVPYAELKCAKPGTSFPYWIIGEFYVGAQNVWACIMNINESDSVHAVYRADSWHIWQWLWGDTLTGTKQITFSVPYSRDASFSICVGQVEFCVDDVIFQDTLSIDGYYPEYTACYPDGDYMRFGASVSIDLSYQNWPTNCEQFGCTIDAYKDDSLLVSTKTDSIVPDHFYTKFYDSEYMIHGFQEVNIPIDWLGKVYGYAPGPRPVGPTDPLITLRILHAFRADSIRFQSPPPDTIYPGDTLMTVANPYPMLSENRRIKYLWNMTPTGVGRYKYGTNFPSIYRNNPFIAENPGACQLYYIVEDTASSTHYADTSAYLPIQVMGPRIVITAPANLDKVTFDSSATGILSITATGTVNPLPAYQDSLIWSITPIAGCSLLVSPPDARGQTVDFTFRHLPSDNDEFGNKYIKASLPRWNLAESVLVQVFFTKYASNHPLASHPEWPNWYYYWRYTPAMVVAPQEFGGDSCLAGRAGYYDAPRLESKFHICDSAATISYSYCDSTNWDGIDLFAATERHENEHYVDMWTFWPNGYNQAADMDPPVYPDTIYGDLVPDTLEGTYLYPNFNRFLKDSDNDGYIDFEDLGYDQECTWIKGTADSVDWANPGHQY
jgi:hypothetical protein